MRVVGSRRSLQVLLLQADVRSAPQVLGQRQAQCAISQLTGARQDESLGRKRPAYTSSPIPLLHLPWREYTFSNVIQLIATEQDTRFILDTHVPLPHLSYRRSLPLVQYASCPARTSLGLDSPIAKRLCEPLSPHLQVRLPRIEPCPIRSQRSHCQMHVRMTALVMQGEYVGKSLPERLLRKRSRRIVQPYWIRASRHAQDDRAGQRTIPSAAGFKRRLYCPVRG
ncbi:hypothetical protein CD943_00400 [Brevundimonas diminuta]|uniref:Uncharacterized protein n=1 Tax=Brevundimonas diminuta TaxID=293 RepID=A0A1Z3LTK1_BREDI|nr:hypothetical protein CD943_00400 [Brevundimonas diminuta]